MINDPTDEGALAVQDLTFARLCPLLILLVRYHASRRCGDTFSDGYLSHTTRLCQRQHLQAL